MNKTETLSSKQNLKDNSTELKLWLGLTLFVVVALLRFLPHPANFAPMTAMMFAAPFFFRGRLLAYLIPTALILITDLIIGVYPGISFNYLAYALVAGLGFFQLYLARNSSGQIFRALGFLVNSVAGAVLFFLASNFGVWWAGGLYPRSADGLLDCYVLAIPFFNATLSSHLFFVVVLFAGKYLAQRAAVLLLHKSRN